MRQRAQRDLAGVSELRRRPDPVGLQRDQAAGNHTGRCVRQLELSSLETGVPAMQWDTMGEQRRLAEAHEELPSQ